VCLEKQHPLPFPQAGQAVARRGAGSGRAQRIGDGSVAGGAAGGAPGALRRRRWAAAGDARFRPPSHYTDSLWKRITRAYHSWVAHLVVSGGDGRPGLGFRVYNFRCAALGACIHVQCICVHGWKPPPLVSFPFPFVPIRLPRIHCRKSAHFLCHVLLKSQ